MEITQDSMNDLTHIQVDHLKHLTAFVQAQVWRQADRLEIVKIIIILFQEEYYANGHKVMQELYKDLWGYCPINIYLNE